MPVNTPHPDYERFRFRWEEARAASMGLHAVRSLVFSRGVPQTTGSSNIRYASADNAILPKPRSMKDDREGNRAYHSYVMCADWFGATERSLAGLPSIVLRKPGTVQVPPDMESWLPNITLTGMGISELARQGLERVLLLNRWALVSDNAPELQRGFLTPYEAEQLINWREMVIDGARILTLAVLREHVQVENEADPFLYETEVRYRVYELRLVVDEVSVNADEMVQIPRWEAWLHIFRETEQDGMDPEMIDTFPLMREEEPLTFLPVQIVPTVTPDTSVLQPLVSKNYTHYRHSADYEQGLRLTGRPTGVITGHQDETEEYILGSDMFLEIAEPEAKVYFLEYQGAGLGEMSARMETDKQEMAMLVSRLLEGQALVQETATAVQARQMHEGGSLREVADQVSEAMQRGLRWAAWWAGVTDNVEDETILYQLNRDFISQQMTPEMFNSLMAGVDSGKISFETFFYNLEQGEMYPPGHDIDTEKALIETQQPAV